MIRDPGQYLERFYEAGADCVTIHIEAVPEPRELLTQIRELGAASGIALNPATDLATLDGCLDLCDLVLVMSVPAGFGGQDFDEIALEKLAAIRQQVGDEVLLEVDGGVNPDTIGQCTRAGAHLLVAGSAVFGSSDYGQAIQELDRLAANS
jgi:ribulose-phosphate 3-epimerase